MNDTSADAPAWPADIYQALRDCGAKQVCYVPDGGHKHLINMCHDDPELATMPLTTEAEGIGVLTGAWLGGQRGVLLMQCSGAGNCINQFGILDTCNLPFFTIITMRGEWGEANPWQIPMGKNTEPALEMCGFTCHRVDRPEDAGPTVAASMDLAYLSSTPVAVILSQRLIGAKKFNL